MDVKINGAVLRDSILHMIGNRKGSVTFRNGINGLWLQSRSDIVIDMDVPVLNPISDNFQITVEIDFAISLLEDLETVITIVEDIMIIRQKGIEIHIVRSPEEGIEENSIIQEKLCDYSLYELKVVAGIGRSLDLLAKSLAVTKSDIQIIDNKAYISYTNTMVIMPVHLPDMSIASDALRKVVSILGKAENLKYGISADHSVLYFHVTGSESISVQIGEPNKSCLNTELLIASKAKPLTEVVMEPYKSRIEKVCTAYKQAKIELAVHNRGLYVMLDNITSKFAFGINTEKLYTIRLSIPQLNAVDKIFGSSSATQILHSENVLILKDRNTGVQLLISGVAY